MRFGVVVFPGSNCDHDMMHVMESLSGQPVAELWHKDQSLQGLSQDDCIVLPGGFSYGDYLRAGAIARFSPIMKKVITFAEGGGLVLGVCNGFQILCEAGLLPGVLLRNEHQKFVCKNVYLLPQTKQSAITSKLEDRPYKIPIAHADGRYYCSPDVYEELIANDQVIFRYCDEEGNLTQACNPNGAKDNIAGICNLQRNVIGMMPHPERAADPMLGNEDGRYLLESLLTPVAESTVSTY